MSKSSPTAPRRIPKTKKIQPLPNPPPDMTITNQPAPATDWTPQAAGMLRFFGEQDLHFLREGSHSYLYEVLGAHPRTVDGQAGWLFAVWAPNASRVSVIGDWNHWDGLADIMEKDWASGVWVRFVPDLGAGWHYKFEVQTEGGGVIQKSDPLAFFSQHGSATSSMTWDHRKYIWKDEAWMNQRDKVNPYHRPMSIYEVHLGSWARMENEGGRPLSYVELASALLDYVCAQGFTHIELLPVTEHPYEPSWGYQVTGYFAPTSRFGNPDEFKQFIDQCHQRGIGVILDWVPAHFPKDVHGLAQFDGTCLYEHADSRLGEHPDWGTLVFNYDRVEVRNFLIASALFWLREYHLDGLRVDAVASMLYLDYSREEGKWLPNVHGGRENLAAVHFLRQLNAICYAECPGILMIAEESTAWPGVTKPVHEGGLGFGLKWNMGWMHDTLAYLAHEPIHRKYHHNEATFSLVYAWSEQFVLPLSHDEVVHGKKSLLEKMPGDRWQKFANLRLLYAWMWAHPGKKLLFMGSELAQVAEWNEQATIEWNALLGQDHVGVQNLVRDLNHLYVSRPALHALCHSPEGFQWCDPLAWDTSIFTFRRLGPSGEEMIVAINATPVPRPRWRIGVSHEGDYHEVLNSDASRYGGTNLGNAGAVRAQLVPWEGQPASIEVTLPPLAVLYFERAQ